MNRQVTCEERVSESDEAVSSDRSSLEAQMLQAALKPECGSLLIKVLGQMKRGACPKTAG